MEQNLYIFFLKLKKMRAIELKKELHSFIEEEDDKSVKVFYQMVKSYIAQKRNDRMITESEEDIKLGRIHSLQDVKQIIESWKE